MLAGSRIRLLDAELSPRNRTMATPNLEKYTLKELNELSSRIEAELQRRKEAERASLKQRIDELTSKAGLSVQELYGMSKGRGAGRGGKVAIKYMNPENKSETWTGRGRQPRWLAAKLAKGAKLADFTL
jgi:DNA-binding protein H-NS